MSSLKIIDANISKHTVFEINGIVYLMEPDSSGGMFPYKLFEIKEGAHKKQINTSNITHWLYVNTDGKYSLDRVNDLAKSFIDGQDSAYKVSDILKYSDIITDFIISKIFDDGLCGKYSGIYSAECTPHLEMKRTLHYHEKVGISENMRDRFVHVCDKNGMIELSESWQKLRASERGAKTDDLERGNTLVAITNDLKKDVHLLINKLIK